MAFSLGGFAGGLSDGWNEGVKRENTQQDRADQAEINDAYGNTLASVFGGQVQQPQAQPSLFERIGTGFSNIFGGGDQGGQPPQPLPSTTPGLLNPAAMQQPQGPTTSLFQQQGAPLPPSQGAQPPPGQPGMPQGQLPPAEQARAPAAPTPPPMPVKLPEPNSLTWQQIVQRVQASNPNASPAVIAGVADRFRPFMTDQAKSEWQKMQMEMKGQMLDLRDKIATVREAGLNQRAADAEKGKGTRQDKQIASTEGIAAANEEGRNTRFQQQQERLESQFNQRLDMARQKFEQAKNQSDRASAAREYERAQIEYRDASRQQLELGKSMLFGPEKDAATKRIAAMLQESSARLDALKRAAAGGQGLQGTPGSPYGGLNTPPGGSYPDRDTDQGAIERSPTVQSARRGPPTASAAPPPSAAPTASAQPSAGGAPPIEAFQGLQEGKGRPFKDAQGNVTIWTIRNGQPARVQ